MISKAAGLLSSGSAWRRGSDPPSAATITVTLTAAEARTVQEAMLLAGAYLLAEIEGEKVASQPPPLEGIGSLRALAAEIEAGQTSDR